MKKKIYEQPEIEVVEMEAADIICTSGSGDFTPGGGGGIGAGGTW